MSGGALPKICPMCKGKDITAFSKCRFCGARYDAVAEKSGGGINQGVLLFGSLAVLGLIGFFATAHQADMQKAKNSVGMAEALKTYTNSTRPKVVEFYADWCGPCKAYGPIVEAAKAKYADKVDVIRLNVDAPEVQALADKFAVSSIPKTCFLNSAGIKVDEIVGGVDAETLDKSMAKIVGN
jgi:thioredoxin 1